MAKDTRLNVRIERDELEKIQQAATDAGMKISDYVLEAVRYRVAGGSVDLTYQLKDLNDRLARLEKQAA
ncbi:MAG: DUF1778 domain-containing protein [Cyanobacteria bacterium P01_D01_bin.116]